jgi:hypothetical protein
MAPDWSEISLKECLPWGKGVKQKKRGEEIAEETDDLVPIYNRGRLQRVIQGMSAAISPKLTFFSFRIC